MLLSRITPVALALFAGSLGLATRADAYPVPAASGSLVAVTIEVDGRSTPLYSAPDGSGRFYLEARAGRPYARPTGEPQRRARGAWC
jgi:hypothetical protein